MRERTSSKSYPTEFKESAVKLALESDRPQAQIARELGVSKVKWLDHPGQTAFHEKTKVSVKWLN